MRLWHAIRAPHLRATFDRISADSLLKRDCPASCTCAASLSDESPTVEADGSPRLAEDGTQRQSLGPSVLCSICRSLWPACPLPLALDREPMRHLLAMLTLVVLAGSRARVTSSVVQAPNPDGCYAFVYESAEFSGARYVLNGPRRLVRSTRRWLRASRAGTIESEAFEWARPPR